MWIQFLSLGPQLSLPLCTGRARFPSTKTKRLLPYLRLDPVQSVSLRVRNSLDDAVILMQGRHARRRRQLANELWNLLNPELRFRHLESDEDLMDVRQRLRHRHQDYSVRGVDGKSATDTWITRYDLFFHSLLLETQHRDVFRRDAYRTFCISTFAPLLNFDPAFDANQRAIADIENLFCDLSP